LRQGANAGISAKNGADMNEKYKLIAQHYEGCLEKYGDSHLGVDWPKLEDVTKRYKVMLDIIRLREDNRGKVQLLDFGCGTAHLYEHITANQINNIQYAGLDISSKFIEVCKSKYPQLNFYCVDILKDENKLPAFDYVVMNGVFTEKREMTFDEMFNFFQAMLERVFKIAERGIAFNVMSKAVDWERDDLFHMPADLLINFLTKKLSRNFIIRNDYGLYEYTTYLYK
jgi:SAM-dependent methyltransferase